MISVPLKELEILFFAKCYNIMSKNILDEENKFTYELLYISLLNCGQYTGKCLSPGCSEIIGNPVTITRVQKTSCWLSDQIEGKR